MTHDNSNQLALWVNDKREKQTHPHLRGQGETDKEVWVSAWLSDEINDEDKKLLQGIFKRYSSKKPLISIRLQAKDEAHKKGMSQAKKAATSATDDDFDDDIPF